MSLQEEIDQVPWAQLRHAYGSADDTPGHILALLATNEEEREQALDELWASICHQGSVYEASCAAIPFLITILEYVEDEMKIRLLYLLADLAHRDWYADRRQKTLQMVHDAPSSRHQWWSVGEFLEKGNEYHEPKWMQKAHRLVGEGLLVYLRLLSESNDEDIHLALLYLFSGFRELNARIIPAVEARFGNSAGHFLQAGILFCFSTLLDEQAPQWERYTQVLSGATAQKHPLLRFAAAYALAIYHPQAVNQAAVEVLIDAVVFPQRFDEQVQVLPWSVGSVHVEARNALAKLGIPMGIDGLVTALMRGKERWRVVDTIRIVEALLDLAFFGDSVQGRYWSHSVKKSKAPSFPQGMVELLNEHDDLYEDRSYYNYGYTYTDKECLEITCFGYDEQAAEQLKQKFHEQGGRALSPAQRTALEAVAACDPLWQVKNNLMEVYGLPTTRVQLEQFLL